MGKMRRLIGKTVTIADSASLSGAIDLGGETLVGIITPSGWTTAGISFQAADSLTGTYRVVWDDTGAEYTIPSVSANKYVMIQPNKLVGLQYIKIQSGTNGSAVAQSGGDILTLITAPLD